MSGISPGSDSGFRDSGLRFGGLTSRVEGIWRVLGLGRFGKFGGSEGVRGFRRLRCSGRFGGFAGFRSIRFGDAIRV